MVIQVPRILNVGIRWETRNANISWSFESIRHTI